MSTAQKLLSDMKIVLFWDIDGTLLTTARAGIFAWEDAACDLFHRAIDLQSMKTAGLTDFEIARLIVQTHAPESDGEIASLLLRSYERSLPKCLSLRSGCVLENVQAIFQALQDCSDVLSLLLTGNTRIGAEVKLRYYGLSCFLEDGAFSDDGETRTVIAERACRRAEELLGESPDLKQTYVIGDTPHDIACGKSIGARTIAVASGVYSYEELEKHRPWWNLYSLPPPEDFFQKVGIKSK